MDSHTEARLVDKPRKRPSTAHRATGFHRELKIKTTWKKRAKGRLAARVRPADLELDMEQAQAGPMLARLSLPEASFQMCRIFGNGMMRPLAVDAETTGHPTNCTGESKEKNQAPKRQTGTMLARGGARWAAWDEIRVSETCHPASS